MPTILQLTKELAHFEKASHRVQATESALASTITFAPSRGNPNPKTKYAHCILVTLPPESSKAASETAKLSSNPAFNPPAIPETKGAASASSVATDADRIAEANIMLDETAERVAGFAVYSYSYSTWLASPGVHLEDLYVRPEYRRCGFASLLFARLGQEVKNVCGDLGGRLDWICLQWNENALKFYEEIGGQRGDGWVGLRVEGKEGVDRLVALGEGKMA